MTFPFFQTFFVKGKSIDNKRIRVRMSEIGVEMRGIRVCMWEMQETRARISRMKLGGLGIRLEMQSNWGKNNGLGKEIKHARSGEG